jgi:hypothetical protein
VRSESPDRDLARHVRNRSCSMPPPECHVIRDTDGLPLPLNQRGKNRRRLGSRRSVGGATSQSPTVRHIIQRPWGKARPATSGRDNISVVRSAAGGSAAQPEPQAFSRIEVERDLRARFGCGRAQRRPEVAVHLLVSSLRLKGGWFEFIAWKFVPRSRSSARSTPRAPRRKPPVFAITARGTSSPAGKRSPVHVLKTSSG